jgi:hypothetical protein
MENEKKNPNKPTFVSPASEALATSTSESCISKWFVAKKISGNRMKLGALYVNKLFSFRLKYKIRCLTEQKYNEQYFVSHTSFHNIIPLVNLVHTAGPYHFFGATQHTLF